MIIHVVKFFTSYYQKRKVFVRISVYLHMHTYNCGLIRCIKKWNLNKIFLVKGFFFTYVNSCTDFTMCFVLWTIILGQCTYVYKQKVPVCVTKREHPLTTYENSFCFVLFVLWFLTPSLRSTSSLVERTLSVKYLHSSKRYGVQKVISIKIQRTPEGIVLLHVKELSLHKHYIKTYL